ncbi:MAG: ABC transporter permease [Bryobacterales bacterium]|nr:ABC transporter permease [Bryobacterales bacterium]
MVRYLEPSAKSVAAGGALRLSCTLENQGEPFHVIGYQIYDPETGLFIQEGDWLDLGREVGRGSSTTLDLALQLPEADGVYRVYVSPRSADGRWLYVDGGPLLLVDAEVSGGQVHSRCTQITTLRRLRWAGVGPGLRRLLTEPFALTIRHAALVRSMVRREVLARYRGSFGDVAWTVLHPLLLMATYFFVFGVVLQSRFGNDPSQTGFALYFLAGMIPWLAFSEPVGRSPYVILEHRNFVKKLVFPVTILPVNLVASGLVTGAIALGLYLIALAGLRGLPVTALALPLLVVPQVLFTLGLCWFLACLGIFLRDLAQIIGFLLTLWFFLTPICYPETSIPAQLMPVLIQNPMYIVVRGYRALLLEGQLLTPYVFAKLWAMALLIFFAGYGWFARLRKGFADLV